MQELKELKLSLGRQNHWTTREVREALATFSTGSQTLISEEVAHTIATHLIFCAECSFAVKNMRLQKAMGLVTCQPMARVYAGSAK